MRRSSLSVPVSVVVSGCMLIVLLLFHPSTGSRAQDDPNGYSPPTLTAFAQASATADSLAATAAYQAPGNGSTTRTAAPVSTTVAPIAPTTGPSASTPIAPTLGAQTPTVLGQQPGTTPVFSRDATPTAPSASPATELEGTPTPTPEGAPLVCAPGQDVPLTGRGPANAGFLVYFNRRIVSGGTVRADGRFAIALTVGNEQAGTYPVEVRVRGTRELLAEFSCQVPATTPTPFPSQGIR